MRENRPTRLTISPPPFASKAALEGAVARAATDFWPMTNSAALHALADAVRDDEAEQDIVEQVAVWLDGFWSVEDTKSLVKDVTGSAFDAHVGQATRSLLRLDRCTVSTKHSGRDASSSSWSEGSRDSRSRPQARRFRHCRWRC